MDAFSLIKDMFEEKLSNRFKQRTESSNIYPKNHFIYPSTEYQKMKTSYMGICSHLPPFHPQIFHQTFAKPKKEIRNSDFQFRITKSFDFNSRFKLLHLPIEDIIFLHNLSLEIEDFHLSLEHSETWSEIQNQLLTQIKEIRKASEFKSMNVSNLIQILKNQILKFRSLEIHEPSKFQKNVQEFHLSKRNLDPYDESSENISKKSFPESSTELPTESFQHFESENGFGSNQNESNLNRNKSMFISPERYFEFVDRFCEVFETILGPPEIQELSDFDTWKFPVKRLKTNSSQNKPREVQPVFFITNRNAENYSSPLPPSLSSLSLSSTELSSSSLSFNNVSFGKEDANALTYGISNVEVRNGKALLKKENQFSFPMNDLLFKEKLKIEIQKNENKSVLVYIHGCFTDFGRAVGYGARISSGLDFDGPVVAFSWPTGGRPSITSGLNVINFYRKDEKSAMKSAHFLKEIIQMICSELGAKNIHIIAYSMGSKTLLQSLDLLKSTPFDQKLIQSQSQSQSQNCDRREIENVKCEQSQSQIQNTVSVQEPMGNMQHNQSQIQAQSQSQDQSQSQRCDDYDGSFTTHLYFMAPDVTAHSFSKITREFKFPSSDFAGDASESGGHTAEFNDNNNNSAVLQREEIHSCKNENENENEKKTISSNLNQWKIESQLESNASTLKNDTNGSSENNKSDPVHSSTSNQDAHSPDPLKHSKSNQVKAPKSTSLEKIQESILEKVKMISSEKQNGENIFAILEKLADSSMSIFEDNFSPLQTIREVWNEARGLGWKELLLKIFGPEESKIVKVDDVPVRERKNFHIHLYAARNDLALLLSELIMDIGLPEIRAGRRTKEFLLCGKTFDTIDASLLHSGVFNTGHFYIFHKIVRADMRNLIERRFERPWWRKMERWNHKYDYFALHSTPMKDGGYENRLRMSLNLIDCEVLDNVTVKSSPLLWMCS